MGKETHILRIETEAKSPSATREYRFSLCFYVFQERELHIAYCPSLDISTSGRDFNDAVANFYECLQLHVESCVEAGTLEDDLLAHGWRLRAKTVTPPNFSTLMKKREMRELMAGNIGFEKVVAPARISVAV